MEQTDEALASILNLGELLDKEVKAESGPGYPLLSLGFSTNAKLIEHHRSDLIQWIVDRIRILASLSNPSDMSPMEFINSCATSPVRLFIKNEPHTEEKLIVFKYRLISSLDLIDQVIERLLDSAQNLVEIKHWMKIPSAAGCGFSSDAQIEAFRERIFEDLKSYRMVQSDQSNWDWTVQEWELDLDRRVREILSGEPPNSLWVRLGRARTYAASRSVFVNSFGEAYVQKEYGLMKSGRYDTSSSNSRIRFAAALMVGATYARCMGDDCIEYTDQDPEELIKRYELLGHKCKFAEVVTEENLQFCSMTFLTGVPSNWEKMFSKLLSHETLQPELRSEFTTIFVNNMRNHPMREQCLKVLSLIDWNW